MYKILAMDGSKSLKDTFDDVTGFLKVEESLLFRTLIRVDISLVAKLHNDEDPALICISLDLPSKVRESLTML